MTKALNYSKHLGYQLFNRVAAWVCGLIAAAQDRKIIFYLRINKDVKFKQ